MRPWSRKNLADGYATLSINVASSASAFELLTRFDTAQRCRYSFDAGSAHSSLPSSFSHGANCFSVRNTGIPPWISGSQNDHHAGLQPLISLAVLPFVPKTNNIGGDEYQGCLSVGVFVITRHRDEAPRAIERVAEVRAIQEKMDEAFRAAMQRAIAAGEERTPTGLEKAEHEEADSRVSFLK